MATTSQSACHRCREQKLRCSREQPTCERCARLGHAPCTYPDPPDRKLLAEKRIRARKRKRGKDEATTTATVTSRVGSERNDDDDGGGGDDNVEEELMVTAVPLPPPPTMNPKVIIASTSSTTSETMLVTANGESLSTSTERLLRDVYFAYVFNSSLILHRASFEQAWAKGDVPRYLALAVFAIATNFLDPPCEVAERHADEVRSLGDVKSLGRLWAQTAGEMVLLNIDEPTLEKAQTCQVLTLYWFAVGESRRNIMFSGIAYRASREMIVEDQKAIQTQSDNVGSEVEMRRRCFWTSYIAYCVNGDHYIVGSSADTFVMSLPLPISERSFLYSIQEHLVSLSDLVDDKNKGNHSCRNGESSVWAEILRLVSHWSKVRDHIEGRRHSSTKEFIVDLLTLDDWLLKYSRGLASSLAYSKENLRAQIAEKQTLSFALFHVFWNQCRLVLHSSIVPQFSGQPLQDDIPHSIIRSSARTAVESARTISRIATDLLSLDEDLARLAPFIGYAMYVAASVHIAFVSPRSDQVREEAWRNLEPALKVLKRLLPYWKNLDRLWARIHVLYEAQTSRLATSLPENDLMSPESVEQVAEMQRDAGRLDEPLANSILEYSLQRLHRSVPVNTSSTTARRLEAAAAMDSRSSRNIARIIHGDDQTQIFGPTPSDTQASVLENNPPLLEPVQQDTDALLSSSMAQLFDNSDWWSFEPDSFQPAILPFPDLFGDGMM